MLSTSNIEWVEVLWTLIALTGFIFASMNFAAAYSTNKFSIQRKIKNGRLIVIRTVLWTELSRAIIQAIEVAIGVFAMTIPRSDDISSLPLRFVIFGYLFKWGLITCATLTLWNSVISWRTRKYFETGKGESFGNS